MRNFFYTTIALFALTLAAAAHPLGNFSVNQYTRLEVETAQIKLRAVLDLAEIPTFQASAQIDADKDGALSEAELNDYAAKISPDYVANLTLDVDGKNIELRAVEKNISLPVGAGNLPTLRVEWDLIGDLPAAENQIRRVRFENKNNAQRLGWNEIVVGRTAGINIFDSTAFGSGATDEIKNYPEETLNAPLAERAAEFSVSSNAAVPPAARPLENRDGKISAPVAARDKFAELIAVPEITPQIILFGLLVAFGLGAAHALSPGHGKAVVGAYLVGSRGTPRHAVFLGATVTVTHTIGVFALGIVMYFASAYILPERIMPYLSFASGLLVLIIGLTLFKDRLFAFLGYQTGGEKDAHGHEEDPAETFTHTHGGSTHTHVPPQKVTWGNLLALGISGGLLPCPSALVLMLAAIGNDRIGYGIVLTLVFSLGLAATLTAVGLIFLYGGRIFDSPTLSENRFVKTVPLLSALVIACVGAMICYSSLV